jgi:hypothetical protein
MFCKHYFGALYTYISAIFLADIFNLLILLYLNSGMRIALISVCLSIEFERLNGSEGCLVFKY